MALAWIEAHMVPELRADTIAFDRARHALHEYWDGVSSAVGCPSHKLRTMCHESVINVLQMYTVHVPEWPPEMLAWRTERAHAAMQVPLAAAAIEVPPGRPDLDDAKNAFLASAHAIRQRFANALPPPPQPPQPQQP